VKDPHCFNISGEPTYPRGSTCRPPFKMCRTPEAGRFQGVQHRGVSVVKLTFLSPILDANKLLCLSMEDLLSWFQHLRVGPGAYSGRFLSYSCLKILERFAIYNSLHFFPRATVTEKKGL